MEEPNQDDFCNAFWGDGIAGFEAVLNRIKAGSKTLEDLRLFYKERASIEEDYAKRLLKLSKQHLGREELGHTKTALDRVRVETANASDAHEKLAAMIRSALEAKTRDFEVTRENKKRNPQANIEKAFKNKLTQETAVLKAREKYKTDCVSVNGYTAQTSLVQGRELDKAQAKLDKAQATIAVNEREYRAYVNVLKESTSKWQLDWKSFTDLAQDVEEERLNYMRISLWEYANGISLICVTDDEFCESIRKGLEQCDATSDLSLFAQQHGSGNNIVDPPGFIDFAAGDYGSSAARQGSRTANFVRSSARTEYVHTGQSLADLGNAIKPMQNHQHYPSTASGAVTPTRSRSGDGRSSRRGSQADLRDQQQQQQPTHERNKSLPRNISYADGLTVAAASEPVLQQNSILAAEPVRRTASPSRYSGAIDASSTQNLNRRPSQREIARDNYRKSLNLDQQGAASPTTAQADARSPTATNNRSRPFAKEENDLEAALAALRDPATASDIAEQLPGARDRPAPNSMAASGSMRANRSQDIYSPTQAASNAYSSTSNAARGVPTAFAQAVQPREPPRKQSVGNLSTYDRSRPASPAMLQSQRAASPAPVASMMQAPATGQSMPGQPHVNPASVVGQYGQSFPGERSRSRANSIASVRSQGPPQVDPTYLNQQHQQSHQSQQSQQQQQQYLQQQLQQAQQRQGLAQARPLSSASGQFRSQNTRPISPSPNSPYAAGSRPQSVAQPQQYAPQAYQSQQSAQQMPHSVSDYGGSYRPQSAQIPQQSYGPPPNQQQAAFRQSSPAPNPAYRQSYAGAPSQQLVNGVLTPAQTYAAEVSTSGQMHRSQSQYAAHSSPVYAQARPGSTQPPPQQQQQQLYTQNAQPRFTQAPQPQPQRPQQPPAAGQQGHGRPVIFFVRAMYDYQATLPEEFSFQANDIIAVFETAPDGWWQGELLDEERRHLGGQTFPSNFCTLLE